MIGNHCSSYYFAITCWFRFVFRLLSLYTYMFLDPASGLWLLLTLESFRETVFLGCKTFLVCFVGLGQRSKTEKVMHPKKAVSRKLKKNGHPLELGNLKT